MIVEIDKRIKMVRRVKSVFFFATHLSVRFLSILERYSSSKLPPTFKHTAV